jgi:hypothetical protein
MTAWASPAAANITWGGALETASADIFQVKIECVPNRHAAADTDTFKRAGYTDYEIAATATVTYKIKDPDVLRANLDAEIKFEAVSQANVVLGSAKGSFQLVRGGAFGTASAKITGLSSEEIRRVRSIRAAWLY